MATWMLSLTELGRWLRDAVIRLVYGLGPLESILRRGPHSARMTQSAMLWARCGGAGASEAAALLGDGPEDAAASLLLTSQRMDPTRSQFHSLVMPNLRSCLAGARALGALRASVAALAAQPVEPALPAHAAMLECAWARLGAGWGGAGEEARDWQVLGFQRRDTPVSDFRASGAWGLTCVAHFAREHAATGAAIARATSLPTTGYPLALALIHASVAARSLLEEGLLDGLLEPLGAAAPRSSACAESEGQPPGLAALAEVAAQLLLLLDDAWLRAQPPLNVMAFNAVWARVQAEVTAHLRREQAGSESGSAGGPLLLPRPLRRREAAAAPKESRELLVEKAPLVAGGNEARSVATAAALASALSRSPP